ncbi:MAG TPA: type II secretion system protein, partial [Usitatibacter sp.]|nr:type II secretion system protein [Usitatibacter sp.]
MRKPRGFTLIEIVVVLAIVSLLLAMATFATRAITIQQRISTTATRLATVDAALVQFVMVQKRLPCPANGTLPSSDPNAGSEDPASRTDAAGCTTNQQNGVVPWKAIGLSENDATDGWLRRITYRVDATLAGAGAMDMSGCDPAGTGTTSGGTLRLCLTTCTAGIVATSPTSCTAPLSFLQGDGTPKGLTVQTLAGTKVMDPSATPTPTGAAYVLISHGESGGGAYLNTGNLASSTSTDGTEEQKNYANLPLAGYYVDDSISDVPGATHFDDMLSHPTILTVISKAAL